MDAFKADPHTFENPKSASVKRLKIGDKTVDVFVMTSQTEGARAQVVASFFDDPLFDPALTTVDGTESERFIKVLRKSKEEGSGAIVVIKDSSVTNASPKHIAKVVSMGLALDKYDIIYLCRWQDNCSALTEGFAIEGTSTRIFTTKSPGGLQAVVITPSGRDKLLGDADLRKGGRFQRNHGQKIAVQVQESVRAGELKAGCVVPNLVDFNLSDAKKPEDYVKTSECQMPSILEEPAIIIDTAKETAQGTKEKIMGFLKRNKTKWHHPGLVAFFVIGIFLLIGLVVWLMRRSPTKEEVSPRQEVKVKKEPIGDKRGGTRRTEGGDELEEWL